MSARGTPRAGSITLFVLISNPCGVIQQRSRTFDFRVRHAWQANDIRRRFAGLCALKLSSLLRVDPSRFGGSIFVTNRAMSTGTKTRETTASSDRGERPGKGRIFAWGQVTAALPSMDVNPSYSNRKPKHFLFFSTSSCSVSLLNIVPDTCHRVHSRRMNWFSRLDLKSHENNPSGSK